MKHLLLTGATRGLGRALAVGFARDGWAVSGCGTSRDGVDALASELGAPHLVMPCDVTHPTHVRAFVRAAIDRHGPPDLLVNNAALINRNNPLWEVTPDEFSRVIDVNLKGVHLVIHEALPAMLERGSGVVVNLSSGWGRSTSPEVAPYCTTKWGIEGMTKALADELPEGLAAVPLNPGVIDTDMLRGCWGEGAASARKIDDWAASAVPFLRGLGPKDNGRSLSVP